MVTKVKLLDEKAKMPKRAHSTDSGYDIEFIGVDKIVGDVIFFKTGLAISPPKGFYYEVVPRSSISKLSLQMANSFGVIDEHYRGEVIVPIRIMHSSLGQEQTNTSFPNGIIRIFNTRPSTMKDVAHQILIKKPVLCQMILRRRIDSEFELVDDLDVTDRGEGGFGSTDKS